MLLQYSKARSESGAVMPLFAIILVVALIFAALSLDLGDTMRRQGNLHTALDASVLRGAKMIRDGESRALAESVTARLVRGNILAKGFGVDEANYVESNLQVTSTTSSVRANSIIRHENWFAQFLGNYNQYLTAPADAEAAFAPPGTGNECVFIRLILDSTGSMTDPIDLSVPVDTSDRTQLTGSKARATADAAISFVQSAAAIPNADITLALLMFNEDPLSVPSGMELPPLSLANPSDVTRITGAINSLPSRSQSWTNVAGVMRRARDLFAQEIAANNYCANRFVIFMSDGAPTSVRRANTRYVCGAATNPVNSQFRCSGNRTIQTNLDICAGNGILESDQLKQLGVPIYAIGFGPAGASGVEFFPDFMERVAGVSGINYPILCPALVPMPGPSTNPPGQYYQPTDQAGLLQAFQDAFNVGAQSTGSGLRLTL